VCGLFVACLFPTSRCDLWLLYFLVLLLVLCFTASESCVIYSVKPGFAHSAASMTLCSPVLLLLKCLLFRLMFSCFLCTFISLKLNRKSILLASFLSAAASYMLECSPVAKPHIFGEPCNTVHTKFFLLFLYLWSVIFKNLNDATLATLGNLRNMKIKAATTENLIFINISVKFIPIFSVKYASSVVFCWR